MALLWLLLQVSGHSLLPNLDVVIHKLNGILNLALDILDIILHILNLNTDVWVLAETGISLNRESLPLKHKAPRVVKGNHLVSNALLRASV